MAAYTPHEIAKALRGDEVSADLVIEISLQLGRLRRPDRALLETYGEGFSAREACVKAGLTGNPQRRFETALRELTRLCNGGEAVAE